MDDRRPSIHRKEARRLFVMRDVAGPRNRTRGPSCAVALVCAFFALWLPATDAEGADEGDVDEYLMELIDRPLDLNGAAAEEIALLPGFSPSVAAAVVDLRRKLGRFESLSDLLRVDALTEPAIARIRPYVTIGPGRSGRTGLRVGGEAGMWLLDETACERAGRVGAAGANLGSCEVGRVTRFGGAGDLYMERGGAAFRVRYRNSEVHGIGGARVNVRGVAVTGGDVRLPGLPALAVELGRDGFSHDGPFPGASLTADSRAGVPAARVTTGAGERLRGLAAQSRRPLDATVMVGKAVGSWGRTSDPVGLIMVKCFSRTAFEAWGGAVGTVRETETGSKANGAARRKLDTVALGSVVWRGRSAVCSAGLANGVSGGAWLFSLRSRPEAWNSVGLALAGRWGDYANPLGLKRFRSRNASGLLARTSAGARPRWVGSLWAEQLLRSTGGGGAEIRRVLTWRKRLRRGTWVEGRYREECEDGIREPGDLRLKLMWKASREGWAEVLWEARGPEDSPSTLAGWRGGAESGFFKVEIGGFSFKCDRSFYFYEREIVGRSSIKALKGEGIGWYLYLRLGSDSGSGRAWSIGSAEIKLRRVSRWDPPASGTFIGVQIGRRGG